METCVLKGINFKQTVEGKKMLIHVDTFNEYCKSIPADERGWRLFNFKELPRLSKTQLFAQVQPIDPNTLKKAG